MADKKISAMTAATTLDGTELIAGVQSGANVKITALQEATYVATAKAATDAQARAQTPATVLLTPANLAGRASFGANKNGSNQTGILTGADTKVTFGTEDWDVGSLFDTTNSRWVPPAGKVRLSAGVNASTTLTASSSFALAIWKNGALWKQTTGIASSGGGCVLNFTVLDSANGTDYYEVYVNGATVSSYQISGSAINTFFYGEQV